MHRENNYFADVVDMMVLYNRSRNWCYKRLREIKSFYGLAPYQHVTVQQLNQYENLPPDTPRPSIGFIKEKAREKDASGS
ncbi:MAG: hypothetical protein K0S09_1408 [Sphingobacteriaceae bacterium]|jgi:hypothetical protein|nr:hypothetical protein [Sphingobacteriaceae bacterium]